MSEWLLYPLAYHIAFGTYGMRLHGDERGTIDRKMNQPGDPIIGSNAQWWEQEKKRLKFPPIQLDQQTMQHAESLISDICARGGWKLYTCAAGPDHIHVLLDTRSDGEAVRKWLKRWLGEGMSQRRPLAAGATWWAEGGSVKWVWTQK